MKKKKNLINIYKAIDKALKKLILVVAEDVAKNIGIEFNFSKFSELTR